MMIAERIICAYLYVITKHGYPPPAADMIAHINEMAGLGFSSIELEGIRKDHLLQVYERRKEISAEIERLGVSVPFFCAVLPGLSSPEPGERNENLALFEKGCEIARLLGSTGILDNGPLPPYRFPGDVPVVRHYHEDVLLAASLPPSLDWKEYWKDLAAQYRTLCEIADRHGLTYHLHPSLGVLCSTTDGFLLFYDAVGRDNLRFTIDTANQYFFRDNLVLALRRLKGLVDYIHCSDNRGARIEHLVPGHGAIRWDVVFEEMERIGYSGYLGIDVGGAETGIRDIDRAYEESAEWIASHLARTYRKE
jgi:sugar phosphate isomerase/epimerase